MDEPPDGIHIGDLVCVRESEQEHADWTIAVIRWISQVKNAPTLLGLELLSPAVRPTRRRSRCPAARCRADPRAPAAGDPLVGQSHTLVVPRMVFKEGQRITSPANQDAFLVKLKRQVASTGYFSQMDFEYLRQLDDDIESSRSESCRPVRLRLHLERYLSRRLSAGSGTPSRYSSASRSAWLTASWARSRTSGLA
jgi:hypothetical protein